MDTTASLHAVTHDTLGEIIDGIAAAEQMIGAVTAWRTRMIEQAAAWAELTEAEPASNAAGWTPEVIARRTVSSELAVALHVPERTAESMVETAKALVRELPATMAALSSGALSYRRAERIVEQSYSVPPEAKAGFDERLAAVAPSLTSAQIDDRARRLREKLHPESITERTRRANENRCVTNEPAQDGMAYLTAYLSAEQAAGIHARLTDLAYELRRTHPDDPRTLAQLRADALADLLVDGSVADGPWNPGIRATVLVTVPALTLLGRTDEPATLEGYGPIAPEVARELAAHAPSFTRLLTHPESGAVLSVGRDSYAVPADLKTWLRVRDGTCRHPGCRAPAARCDIDHTIDWQSLGRTAHDNLAHLCRAHHNLKHHTDWRLRQLGDGVLEWTSPSGRVAVTRPELTLG